MKLTAGPMLAAPTMLLASCGSLPPQPMPVYPAAPRCPALEAPRALTDPVAIPSFLRAPMP